jgi:hypothetical protein
MRPCKHAWLPELRSGRVWQAISTLNIEGVNRPIFYNSPMLEPKGHGDEGSESGKPCSTKATKRGQRAGKCMVVDIAAPALIDVLVD